MTASPHRLRSSLAVIATIATLAGIATLAPRSARAAEPAIVGARVLVTAPPSCASEASFWRATSKRTDRLRPAGAEAEVTLELGVRPEGNGARGDVTITRAGRTFAQRTMSGVSCEDVTEALSLVVALAFDPAARTEVPHDAPPAGAADPSKAAPEAATPAQPAARTVEPVATATAPPTAERPAPRPVPGPRWRFGLGGHAGVLGAAAPSATLAYGGFVELARDAPGLSPSIRVGALHTEGAANAQGIEAEIAWTMARASVCPLRFDLASSVSLRPCAGVDAGSMSAQATGLERTRERARPWVAGTAAVRLAWSPVQAVFVELEGGAAAPFVRDELAVDPSLTLYRAPFLVSSAQVAAGLRFP